jgi:hypothetical protein
VLSPGFPVVPQEPSTRLRRFSRAGASGASQVLRRLASCMPRPVDSGGPSPPRHRGGSCVAFGERYNPRRPPHASLDAVPALQGARSPLRPTGFSVSASPLVVAVISITPPPWTQDSIRGGGSPSPDRDLHPARYAKLSWRDNAHASAAAGSGSDIRAYIVDGWLQALVRPGLTTGSQASPAPLQPSLPGACR